jgi:hypothetical protein
VSRLLLATVRLSLRARSPGVAIQLKFQMDGRVALLLAMTIG